MPSKESRFKKEKFFSEAKEIARETAELITRGVRIGLVTFQFADDTGLLYLVPYPFNLALPPIKLAAKVANSNEFFDAIKSISETSSNDKEEIRLRTVEAKLSDLIEDYLKKNDSEAAARADIYELIAGLQIGLEQLKQEKVHKDDELDARLVDFEIQHKKVKDAMELRLASHDTQLEKLWQLIKEQPNFSDDELEPSGSRYRIIFTRFKEEKTSHPNPGFTWSVLFNNAWKDTSEKLDVSFEEKEIVVRDKKHAREILKKSGAAMVVWGKLSDGAIRVNYEVNFPNDSIPNDFRTVAIISRDEMEVFLDHGGTTTEVLCITLGILEALRGNYEVAVTFIIHALSLIEGDPASELLWVCLAYSLAMIQKEGEAIEAIEKVNLFNEALACLLRAYLYDKLAESEPDSQTKQEEYKAAYENYDKLIHLRPGIAELHVGRGNDLEELERFQEAADDYRKAIELGSKEARTFFCLGNALFQLDKFDEAICAYQKALEVDPAHADSKFNLGEAYAREGENLLEQRDLQGAYDNLKMAVEFNPNDGLSQMVFGTVNQLRGNYGTAKDCFDKAISLSPDDFRGFVCRGRWFISKGMEKEAQADFSKAESLNPRFFAYRSHVLPESVLPSRPRRKPVVLNQVSLAIKKKKT